MTAANVVAFFAEAHWGSRYGVVDQYHPTPHKGLDCGLFHGTVEVPALHDGTVVVVAPSSSVGHYVTVQRADGLFDTYCHIVPAVTAGHVVKQGDPLGRQAVTQAEGGKDWRGQHTHLCLSRTRDGWATWGNWNLDPTPGVIAALTGTASAGGSRLINQRTDSDMYCIGLDQGKPTAVSFSIGVGILQRHSQERQQALAAAQAQQPNGCYWYDDDDFARTMWNHGLGEFTVAQARALTGNDHLIAKAVYGTGAAITLTDAQLATIAASVKMPTPDLSSVTSAIAALAKQESADQAALLTAIGQVDENTLATFGLKRI